MAIFNAMSFRKIYPSSGKSKASNSQPGQLGLELTEFELYQLGEKRETEKGGISSVRRRRVPTSVTKNACLSCKKARAKCDGNDPCRRCASRGRAFPCIYQTHIKHAKEELLKQIKELKAKDHLTEQILHALATDEKVPEILDQLKNGHDYESIVEWLDHFTLDEENGSPGETQHSPCDTSDNETGDFGSTSVWTTVITDSEILDHLLQLYFTWVHPVHTLFNRDCFLESYKSHSAEFCSGILINALCSMACHLQPATSGDEADFGQLGLEFSDAVRADIDAEDKTLTTVQAFAVMFLVDCSRCNALRASSYLRTASNILTRVETLEIEGFQEAWNDTVRGVHSLSVEWAQATFQLPPGTGLDSSSRIESLHDRFDDAERHFYPRANAPPSGKPGLLDTINLEKTMLVRIIEEVVMMMYSPQSQGITAHQLLEKYDKFLGWRDKLPTSIVNVASDDGQTLPHVLSLQILYSSSVVQLLRPLLDVEGLPTELLEDKIWDHAQEGLLSLREHYRSLYTSQYQSTLQMIATLHLIDVIARCLPFAVETSSNIGLEAIQFGLDILNESRARFPVAGAFQEMLRKTATDCGISLSKIIAEPAGLPQDVEAYRLDDLIDACTRPTYVQPISEIQSRYSPSFTADWIAIGSSFGFHQATSGSSKMPSHSIEQKRARGRMQIGNLLNAN